jgi:DNA-binding LacI/PurR family transcriptional regulator
MKGKATSFDIAHHAGVSQSTVSRALRGSPLVNEETRRKVIEVARELNYKVDKNASNLRAQQSSTLALLLFEDPTSDDSQINPFFLSMLGSITRACAKEGYDLLVSFQSSSNDWHSDYAETHRADGIILLGYGDYIDYQAKFARLLDANTKFVCWGASVDSRPELTVSCDNHHGGRLVAEHFIELGRTNCAFIGDASHHSPEFSARFNGFEERLQESGKHVSERKVAMAISTEESGYQATKSLLANDIPFNALFGASDLIAIGAIRALHEAGLRVPQDVAVVGFDDIAVARFCSPPLSTVQQNTTLAGQMLVANLLNLIGEQEVDLSCSVLPPKLVVRQSSRSS